MKKLLLVACLWGVENQAVAGQDRDSLVRTGSVLPPAVPVPSWYSQSCDPLEDKLFSEAMNFKFEALEKLISCGFRYLEPDGKTYSKRPGQLYTVWKNYNAKNAQEKISYLINVLQKTAMIFSQAGDFDVDGFLRLHRVRYDDKNPFFFWELAEQASTTQKFGPPDARLVLQLVLLERHAPAEMSSAHNAVYKNFTLNSVKPFNIADHVTSGIGFSYLAHREQKKEDARVFVNPPRTAQEQRKYKIMITAQQAAKAFFDAMVKHEESHHGGTLAPMFMHSARKMHMKAFEDMLAWAQRGFVPFVKEMKALDAQLNRVYKTLMQTMQQPTWQKQEGTELTPQTLREDQRLWIEYRDAMGQALTVHNPQVSVTVWKAWLTQIRLYILNKLLKGEDISRMEYGDSIPIDMMAWFQGDYSVPTQK